MKHSLLIRSSHLFAVLAAASVGAMAACGAPEVADEPYTSYDAEAWYRDSYISANSTTCPEPFNTDTECEFRDLLGVQAVDLPAGTRLPDNYGGREPFLYSEPPDPPSIVVLTVPQTVWCFGVKETTRYDYYDEDDFTTPNGHVEYSYPCYSLGPDPNGLGAYVGELQSDGTISFSAWDHCNRKFWNDTAAALDCNHGIQDVPLSERLPIPPP